MKPKAVILFDGVCNLCNNSVQFILNKENDKFFSFASLQSDFGQAILKQHHRDPNDFDSFILLENDVLYEKSTAALKVAKRLRFPYRILSVFIIIPKFLRNWAYGIIAKNRYKWFGKREECMIPSPDLKDRFIV